VLRTLYGKLALALLVLFALIGVMHIALTLFTTTRHIQEVNQELNHSLAEHLVQEKILMRNGQIDQAALEDVFHMLMVINPTIELYLLDPEGKILAYSAPPGSVKRKRVSLDPIRRFLSGSWSLPILGDDPRDLTRQKIFSVQPIEPASDRTGLNQGYLYIVLASEEYDSVAAMVRRSYILRLSTAIAAAGLVCALLGGLFVFNLLTRRLHRLAVTMDRFKQTSSAETLDLAGRARAGRGDEIDRLALSFEEMAERIGQQMRALQEKDELRRVLVANVSHDLRTPLATIHGYLETLLLKEGQLTSEERRQYLEIATKHSERLGKLISALFELSKLESRETGLRIESFSLAELAQDVIQEFQLIAREKSIHLRADFGEKLPFVRADISLIERVLENLIENAIRHTPRRGSVTVSLEPDDGSVRVRVGDTGCGIPEEALPHIFDRFYRVPGADVDRPLRGTGLGLAITKRILELHGSAIDVVSRLRQGTVFTFCLPAVISPASDTGSRRVRATA
jgi:two-component system OmpR family sensor kinase